MAVRVAFKLVVLMIKSCAWRDFLRIEGDGWSSGFASVDLVLKHLSRKSKSVGSRYDYCYIVWSLCSRLKVNPNELVLRARENPVAVANFIQSIGDKYNDAGSIRYANHIIHTAKTFFKVNKVEIDLHGYFQPARSRKRPEYIPTLAEALKMADVAGSLRNRLIILFLAFAGLRNSTLRVLVYNENYPDPLLQEYTVKKERERDSKCLIIIIHEIMKLRDPSACKGRVFYYTFVPPTVTEYLYLHLSEMERKYGSLQDAHMIFPTGNREMPLRERLKTPMSPRELQEIVKKAAKRGNIKNWQYVYPHCLRKTYESFLRNQPDDARLDAKEREFLFGHTLPGSQDTYFDKTKIEEMRAKYAKMNFEPNITVEIVERVICEDELQAYLQNGWHFEATLPSQKVVVSRKVKVKRPEDVASTNTTNDSDAPIQAEKTTRLGPYLEPPALNNKSIKLDAAVEANKVTIEDSQQHSPTAEINEQKNKESQHLQDEHPAKDAKEREAHAADNGKLKQRSLLDFNERDELP